ncbi:hypothetical protein Tco_1121365 [Tanacetum coccineum]|uniref:Uncharacterized protein n=1 Tax=Tanacetum coccineum TaxID=301880 RepID=A0ABQ5IXH2_9ASTR
MDLNKFVVKDDMIDYVLHKYGSNWYIHDAIADDIRDDLLKREWEKQQGVKYTSYDYFPFQATSDKSSDHNPFQVSSDHNHFQASSDDTLKSSSEDTFSSDSTWEQSKASKRKPWSRSTKRKKKDLMRTVYKGRAGSSSRNAAIIKPDKHKSSSKHLAPTIPRIGSTCKTFVVPTKMPPPVTNCVLSLVAVTTWQQIMNKEFRIKKSKEDVGGSSDVRRKGKRKML